MPINWHDKAVQDRLLTAVIASIDKVNVAEIARLYGGEITYHAVENYLRKFRKEAKEMKDDAASRTSAAPSLPKSKAKKASNISPTKAGVKSGRVTKKTPSKVKVKAEMIEDEMVNVAMSEDGGGDIDEDLEEDEV